MLRGLHKAKVKKKKLSAAVSDLSAQDQQLFEALRALRAQLAKEQNVPPYVIFPDKTLTEMAIVKPASEGQLLNISGVGQAKLTRYGEVFLNEISNSTQQDANI